MSTRRKMLLALGALAALPALGQPQKRLRRIGYLSLANVQGGAARLAAFRDGMSELGWIEGRDYVIDARYTNGVAQAAPGLAAELVATRPDLLLTPADEGVRLLAQGTKTIPIVFTIAQDPIGTGLAASLQRPGGNVTGLSSLASELGAKRLQLLKEAFPRVVRIVLLIEPEDIGSVSQAKEIREAAALLGMRVTPIELRQPEDIEPAFKRGAALGAQAYILSQGGVMNSQRRAIADRVLRLKVPAIAAFTEFVEAGGLISYGPTYFRRAAAYVDKIFKGANPGDLPIEQPMKIELVINMKTAKTLGIKFPQSILIRADRVIE